MELSDILWFIIPAFMFLDTLPALIVTIVVIGYALSGSVDLKLEDKTLHITEKPTKTQTQTTPTKWPEDTNNTTGWN